MKGIYGSENNDRNCPECNSPSGAKSYCEACKTKGCVSCVGMEKPYGCNKCGKGPVQFID